MMALYTTPTLTDLVNRLNGLNGVTRAVAGDTVYTPAGNYDNSAGVTLTPAPGIRWYGAGAANTIIKTLIWWNNAGLLTPAVLDGLTIDCTGLGVSHNYGGIDLYDGKYIVKDCEFYGGSSNSNANLLTFAADVYPVRGWMLRCKVHNATRDCISVKVATTTLGALSKLTTVRCEAYAPGVNTNDNCLTCHMGSSINDYESYYHDAVGGPTVAHDDPTSKIRLIGTRLKIDGTATSALSCESMEGCTLDYNGTVAPNGVIVNSLVSDNSFNGNANGLRILPPLTLATETTWRIRRNRMINANAYLGAPMARVEITGNHITDVATVNDGGVDVSQGYTGSGYVLVERNLVQNCYRNYYFRGEGTPTVMFRLNAGLSPTSATVFTFGGTVTFATGSGYNHLNGTLSSYTALTGDVTTAPSPSDLATFAAGATGPNAAQIRASVESVVRGIETMVEQWGLTSTDVTAASSTAVQNTPLSVSPTAGTSGEALLYASLLGGRRGTAQGGTLSSITLDAGASSTPGRYVGDLLCTISGTGAGQKVTITAFDVVTKIAQVYPNLAFAPDNTTGYVTLPAPKADVRMWAGDAAGIGVDANHNPSMALAATGMDAITAAAPANRAGATTFPKLLMFAARSLINTVTRNKASGSQKIYADDDETILATVTSTDDGVTQRKTKAS